MGEGEARMRLKGHEEVYARDGTYLCERSHLLPTSVTDTFGLENYRQQTTALPYVIVTNDNHARPTTSKVSTESGGVH